MPIIRCAAREAAGVAELVSSVITDYAPLLNANGLNVSVEVTTECTYTRWFFYINIGICGHLTENGHTKYWSVSDDASVEQYPDDGIENVTMEDAAAQLTAWLDTKVRYTAGKEFTPRLDF